MFRTYLEFNYVAWSHCIQFYLLFRARDIFFPCIVVIQILSLNKFKFFINRFKENILALRVQVSTPTILFYF